MSPRIVVYIWNAMDSFNFTNPSGISLNDTLLYRADWDGDNHIGEEGKFVIKPDDKIILVDRSMDNRKHVKNKASEKADSLIMDILEKVISEYSQKIESTQNGENIK